MGALHVGRVPRDEPPEDIVTRAVGSLNDDPAAVAGIDALDDPPIVSTETNRLAGPLPIKADLAVVSVRRRVLPAEQVAALRRFVSRGKPVVGLRTASHAFAPRGRAAVPEGRAAWAEFDSDVLGGNYQGHHGEGPKTAIVPGIRLVIQI